MGGLGECKSSNHSGFTLADVGNIPVNHPARGKEPGLVPCSMLAAGSLIGAQFERREAPARSGTPPWAPVGFFSPSALEGEGAGSDTSRDLLCCPCLQSHPSPGEPVSNSSVGS